jgi:hypothetical protein
MSVMQNTNGIERMAAGVMTTQHGPLVIVGLSQVLR